MDSPSQQAEQAQPSRATSPAGNNGRGAPAASSQAQAAAVTTATSDDLRPNPLLSIMRIVLFAWVGILLAILPWQDRWTDNTFLLDHPLIRLWMGRLFIRGAVTGLGVVNLWIAMGESLRFRLR